MAPDLTDEGRKQRPARCFRAMEPAAGRSNRGLLAAKNQQNLMVLLAFC